MHSFRRRRCSLEFGQAELAVLVAVELGKFRFEPLGDGVLRFGHLALLGRIDFGGGQRLVGIAVQPFETSVELAG